MLYRIGIIYPDDNGDESELARLELWLKCRDIADVDVTIAYSPSDGMHDEASLKRTGGLETLGRAARTLKPHGCSAVLWACTSGSFIGGLDNARRQLATIAAAVGAPATSTSVALARAAKQLGIGQVEVLSPYPPAIGQRFAAFLAEFQIKVSCTSHLDSASGMLSRKLKIAEEIHRHEERHGHTTLPLLIPDTALDSLDLVEDLERSFRRPIITANQASVWDVLLIAGRRGPLERAGELFRLTPGERCAS